MSTLIPGVPDILLGPVGIAKEFWENGSALWQTIGIQDAPILSGSRPVALATPAAPQTEAAIRGTHPTYGYTWTPATVTETAAQRQQQQWADVLALQNGTNAAGEGAESGGISQNVIIAAIAAGALLLAVAIAK